MWKGNPRKTSRNEGVRQYAAPGWALQETNTSDISREKPQSPEAGAVKSAASEAKTPPAGTDEGGGAGTDFAEALAMIARLPITDAERADTVRRLLEGQA